MRFCRAPSTALPVFASLQRVLKEDVRSGTLTHLSQAEYPRYVAPARCGDARLLASSLWRRSAISPAPPTARNCRRPAIRDDAGGETPASAGFQKEQVRAFH
jgi:hypothetical protein